jgi:hypothetical protein
MVPAATYFISYPGNHTKKKAYPHHAKSIEFFSISKKKFQLLMDIDYLMELF